MPWLCKDVQGGCPAEGIQPHLTRKEQEDPAAPEDKNTCPDVETGPTIVYLYTKATGIGRHPCHDYQL